MSSILLGPVLDLAGKVFDRVFPDPAQRDAAKLAMFQAQQAGEFREMEAAAQNALAQLEVAKVEAANPSVFVSGARPGLFWICNAALAYGLIFKDFAGVIANFWGYKGPLPDSGLLLSVAVPIIMTLIGAHAYERGKGVAPEQRVTEMPSYQPKAQ